MSIGQILNEMHTVERSVKSNADHGKPIKGFRQDYVLIRFTFKNGK